MKSFLILGGTGKVGSRLAELLRAEGANVRIASRRGGDVRFDWRDHETYSDALAGVDGVFVVGPGSATDWALQDGPLDWTILRPSHFAQNFTEAMFVPVDGRIVAPVASGTEPFIDVLDIAEVAARVLLDGTFAGEILELSGPTALTFDEATAVLADQLNESVTFVDEPLDVHADRLRAAGTPEGYVVWRMAMLAGIRSGADAYVSDGVPRVLGRPATSFANWAAREVHG